MKPISPHITHNEAVRSNTATRKGIYNNPTPAQRKAMVNLATKVFEPVRNFFNKPIRVTSFFRSERLNRIIGGSRTSQHCKGEAMDIKATKGFTNKEIFFYILNNLDFDQLIWEFGDENNPDWIHVSFKMNRPNRQIVLRAIRKNGKTYYVPFESK
jgi:hypothetical protein